VIAKQLDERPVVLDLHAVCRAVDRNTDTGDRGGLGVFRLGRRRCGAAARDGCHHHQRRSGASEKVTT